MLQYFMVDTVKKFSDVAFEIISKFSREFLASHNSDMGTLANHMLIFVELPIEKALMTLCFYSGLRIGEASALEPRNFRPHNSTLRILTQLDREEVRRATKTRRERTVYLCPEFHPRVARAVSAPKSGLTL